MGIGLVKGESALFVKEETTEGVYVGPASASDAVEVLEDGVELNASYDEIERNTLNATIEVVANRRGQGTFEGTIPCEFKTSLTEGAAPREDLLLRSLFGGKRQISVNVTTKTGNTVDTLKIQDADISKFKKNDIILIKEAGKFEVRPISAVDSTLGNATLTLAFPLSSIPSDNVELGKATIYYHDKIWPSFSASYYEGGKIKKAAAGLRCVSMNINDWTVENTPKLEFAVSGLSIEEVVEDTPFTPDFSTLALPPVIRGSCLFIDGVKTQYTEIGSSFENSKTDILSACSDTGKVGSRFTQFQATIDAKVYKEDDNTSRFENFNLDKDTSIFFVAGNPSEVDGEKKNFIAVWFPQCKMTAKPSADADGIITEEIAFKAFRKDGNDTCFVAFI